MLLSGLLYQLDKFRMHIIYVNFALIIYLLKIYLFVLTYIVYIFDFSVILGSPMVEKYGSTP